jgi:hypothetical protein
MMLTNIAERLYALIEKDTSPCGNTFAWPVGVEMTLHSFKGPEGFPSALMESHKWFRNTDDRQEMQAILEWLRGQKNPSLVINSLLMALQIKYALEYGLHLNEHKFGLMLKALSAPGYHELFQWLIPLIRQQRPDLWEKYGKGEKK